MSVSTTPVKTMWDVEPYTLDLSDVVRLSDDDLLKICAANPDLRIERNAAGQLEIMSPSGLSSSAYEAEFVYALEAWSTAHGDGIVVTSSGGFHLPNGAVRAADAAWIRRSDWDALSKNQQDRFAPVVPAFVVEIRSPSDRLPALKSKMDEWIRNGCRLAWLVDPIEETTSVYRADGSTIDHGMDAVCPVKTCFQASPSIWRRSGSPRARLSMPTAWATFPRTPFLCTFFCGSLQSRIHIFLYSYRRLLTGSASAALMD